jgi:hypothetical protein
VRGDEANRKLTGLPKSVGQDDRRGEGKRDRESEGAEAVAFMPGPLHAPPLLILFPFRFRDTLTGRWCALGWNDALIEEANRIAKFVDTTAGDIPNQARPQFATLTQSSSTFFIGTEPPSQAQPIVRRGV